MHTVTVEIFSDTPNRMVVRHPGRKFPGILVQGDSLHALCHQADESCAVAKSQLTPEAYDELDELRNTLWAYLNHYKVILGEHQIPLPFSDAHDV
jgi:hypothetical protein